MHVVERVSGFDRLAILRARASRAEHDHSNHEPTQSRQLPPPDHLDRVHKTLRRFLQSADCGAAMHGLKLPRSALMLRQNSREAAMLRRSGFLVALSCSAFMAAG